MHLAFSIAAAHAVLVGLAIQLSTTTLYPHGLAVDMSDRASCSSVDQSNISLRASSGKLRKIHERVAFGDEPLLRGPETVVFDRKGILYVLTETALLVSLTDFEDEKDGDGSIVTAKATAVADLGLGRPLGGKFGPDGCLYFADAVIGLARRCFDGENGNNVVELLSSSVRLADGTESPILFADDVDVGSKTGHIYFSDASDIPVDRKATDGTWDVLYASVLTAFRGKKTGRLLRYDPATGKTDVLCDGIFFANGVAVDAEETYVLVNETFLARTLKYHLTGEKKGRIEVLADGYPGFSDGIDCSPEKGGACYAAIPSAEPLAAKVVFSLPSPFSRWLRNVILALPRSVTPGPKPYGGVVEVRSGEGGVVRVLQDPDGSGIRMITGVTVFDGKLYLGSLENDFIGIYDLDLS